MSVIERPITDRQKDVLAGILDWRRVHGYPPTYRDLAEVLGLCLGAVHLRVQALVKKGYLAGHRYESRSFELTAKARRLFPTVAGPNGIPVVGTVEAGWKIEFAT